MERQAHSMNRNKDKILKATRKNRESFLSGAVEMNLTSIH